MDEALVQNLQSSAWQFLGVPLYDDDLVKLAIRFLINGIVVSILVFLIYHKKQTRRNYVFALTMMNIMVFFICFTLKKLELGLGMALGLFAVFGILRYRTSTIRVKEMTYLFLVVGLAVINALSNKKTSYSEIFFANAIVLMATWFLEREEEPKVVKETEHSLVYDNIGLLSPDKQSELLADLSQRLGCPVVRVEVKRINLVNNSAQISVFYSRPE